MTETFTACIPLPDLSGMHLGNAPIPVYCRRDTSRVAWQHEDRTTCPNCAGSIARQIVWRTCSKPQGNEIEQRGCWRCRGAFEVRWDVKQWDCPDCNAQNKPYSQPNATRDRVVLYGAHSGFDFGIVEGWSMHLQRAHRHHLFSLLIRRADLRCSIGCRPDPREMIENAESRLRQFQQGATAWARLAA